MFLSPTRGRALKASRMKRSKNFSNTRPLEGCPYNIFLMAATYSLFACCGSRLGSSMYRSGWPGGKGARMYAWVTSTLCSFIHSQFLSASSLVAPWRISFSTANPHSEVLRLSMVLKDSADIMLDDVDQYSCSNLARSPR